MKRSFIYRVRTVLGERLEVEAHTAEEALELLGLTPGQVKQWYPFPVAETQESQRWWREKEAREREARKLG